MTLLKPVRLIVFLTAFFAPIVSPILAWSQAQTPAQQPPAQATVTYDSGKLAVSAENSSLNQILRDISQQTGLKITGGVNDERVYGSYGPGSPASILGQLLDGTGTNIMIVQATGTNPAQLILTPRNGGPSPPDPNSAARNAEQDRGPIGRRTPDNRFNNDNRPGGNPNNTFAPRGSPNSSQPGTTTQPAPANNSDGNLTPQQLFQQRRQQQQQQQPQQQSAPTIRDPLHPQN